MDRCCSKSKRAAAALTYVIAQYRLLGLTIGPFPPQPRSRPRQPQPRPDPAGYAELAAGLLTVIGTTAGAVFLWTGLGQVPPAWDVAPPSWHVGLLIWIMLGGTAVAGAVIGHLGWRRVSRAEAAVFLQDALWHETRREQRRINRWRAWAIRRR